MIKVSKFTLFVILHFSVDTAKVTETWRPFSMRDSMSLEHSYGIDQNTTVLIPTDGGRYDVDLPKRVKIPVYWKDGLNDEMKVCRASWFHKIGPNAWAPYGEELASRLEEEYQSGLRTGQWKREIRIKESNDAIRIIGPSMMFHLPSEHSSLGKLDEWGQVQPPNQDPSQVPREVHRGVEGIIDDIPDGEDMTCDHLVFVIHGIGGACDMKFRPIHEVVDSFRELHNNLSKKHFQRAHLMEQVSRIEFLPINWHKPLHGEDIGTDARLRPLTLKSIPKLRHFVNDTLLDILFYTSPIYCQAILDTVVSEINRVFTLFSERNEDFKGQVSIVGHSLGSLIAFDLLSHQTASNQPEHVLVEKPPASTNELSLEQVFANLEISEYAENFTKEGIDFESLMLCNEQDLKEGGLPLGPRKKLLHYIEVRKAINEKKLSGLDEYRETSITSDVKYRIGPAGTGQPSVFYPKLDFEPASFYALGSPIALFNGVRGINHLGPQFKFPTCPRFFNIFHPYDPVAYRIEALIDPQFSHLRPVTIPHHAGRKRMHLELKDTVTKLMTGDLKKKLLDSVWSGISAIYNTATGTTASGEAVTEQKMQEAMETKLEEQEALDSTNPVQLASELNGGLRIDYVLQEAPYESFNEYVFALGSHLCYWDSEDTSLMILKDIYGLMGVMSDDQLALSEAELIAASAKPPVFVDNAPTAILRPPPTPMGAPMPEESPMLPPTATSTPAPPVAGSLGASTLVPPGSGPFMPTASPLPTTPLAGPTITPISAVMSAMGPPPSGPPMTPMGPSVTPMGPPITSSTPAGPPLGPPPPMMTPNFQPPAGSGGGSNLGRPRRAAYPIQNTSQVPLGMDPTAPRDNPKQIGPPPTAGFMR